MIFLKIVTNKVVPLKPMSFKLILLINFSRIAIIVWQFSKMCITGDAVQRIVGIKICGFLFFVSRKFVVSPDLE